MTRLHLIRRKSLPLQTMVFRHVTLPIGILKIARSWKSCYRKSAAANDCSSISGASAPSSRPDAAALGAVLTKTKRKRCCGIVERRPKLPNQFRLCVLRFRAAYGRILSPGNTANVGVRKKETKICCRVSSSPGVERNYVDLMVMVRACLALLARPSNGSPGHVVISPRV